MAVYFLKSSLAKLSITRITWIFFIFATPPYQISTYGWHLGVVWFGLCFQILLVVISKDEFITGTFQHHTFTKRNTLWIYQVMRWKCHNCHISGYFSLRSEYSPSLLSTRISRSQYYGDLIYTDIIIQYIFRIPDFMWLRHLIFNRKIGGKCI